MKKQLSFLLYFFCALSLSAQQASRPTSHVALSILGDSYSTFRDYVTPDTNYVWYPNRPLNERGEGNDVNQVSQTWWHQLLRMTGWRLEQNNSFSGATICHTGYKGEDYSNCSFVTRARYLGAPDVIIVFGGTNDSWAKAPIGDYQYDGWTKDDLYRFRPAMACLLQSLRERYPWAAVYVIVNTELSKDVTESMQVISRHYGVPVVMLKDIEKQWGHPSQRGMAQIAEQIFEATR